MWYIYLARSKFSLGAKLAVRKTSINIAAKPPKIAVQISISEFN